jgi:hypothetical protein
MVLETPRESLKLRAMAILQLGRWWVKSMKIGQMAAFKRNIHQRVFPIRNGCRLELFVPLL